MLKSTEIRIGNWYNEYGIPKQVTPQLIARLHEIEQAGKTVIDCTPIPIAEEWLLRFGFVIEEDFATKPTVFGIEDRGLLILDGYSQLWKYEYAVGGYTIIKHVHQLQNLYHALTGQELTLTPIPA